ncbi:MAG: HDIG domain-containing protein [Candidatus Bipolaricaulota bacterium]|nr:HDIG domain-containing protein [Candidatus Bipolaricaulota bacterium]
MNRLEALALVEERVKTKNLVKHMLAVEAGMRALAPRFGEDPERWALAGLVHDLDYEETKDRPDLHGHRTVELLRARGFADEGILDAILAHAGHREPATPMEIALTAVDPLTGLVVAAALVHPDKIGGLTPHNVLNRYREKGFARSASREGIALGQRLGLSLEEFVGVVLAAMQAARSELGL